MLGVGSGPTSRTLTPAATSPLPGPLEHVADRRVSLPTARSRRWRQHACSRARQAQRELTVIGARHLATHAVVRNTAAMLRFFRGRHCARPPLSNRIHRRATSWAGRWTHRGSPQSPPVRRCRRAAACRRRSTADHALARQPASTGNPSRVNSRAASSARLCSSVLPNPKPGSMTSRDGRCRQSRRP